LDDQLGFVRFGVVDEEHDVGVLFDRTAFAQMVQPWFAASCPLPTTAASRFNWHNRTDVFGLCVDGIV